jgi:hypothetical protein
MKWSSLTGGEFASPYDIASVYAGLGQKSRALDSMDRALKTRAAMMPFANVDPLLNPLRSDPRFSALLRKAFPRSGVLNKP